MMRKLTKTVMPPKVQKAPKATTPPTAKRQLPNKAAGKAMLRHGFFCA